MLSTVNATRVACESLSYVQATKIKPKYRTVSEGFVMVFSGTFNNISIISWWSVLLVDETAIPGEYHRPVASH